MHLWCGRGRSFMVFSETYSPPPKDACALPKARRRKRKKMRNTMSQNVEIACVRHRQDGSISRVGVHLSSPAVQDALDAAGIVGVPCQCFGCPEPLVLVSEEDAVRLVQEKRVKLIVKDPAGKNPAEVIEVHGEPPHLRTKPDGAKGNNLGAVPACLPDPLDLHVTP